MSNSYLFDPIQILYGPDKKLVNDAVLITNRKIKSFGEDARNLAKKLNIKRTNAQSWIFAPCLVDPHSFLENHFNSNIETLSSLRRKAAYAGYGQIALLPKSILWRDLAEHLQGLLNPQGNVFIHLWGGFSLKGEGKVLSSHQDLLNNGAIGLADNDFIIPIDLLKKGLLLAELKDKPLLIAPRDPSIQGDGIVREGVEALRSGLQQDPTDSEIIPLNLLLALQKQHPEASIRLMNLSTAAGISALKHSNPRPMASVCWWHLIADQTKVSSTELGIKVLPSLGNANDRKKLIEALQERILTGVSVTGTPLDELETLKPTGERRPGLSGHNLVLPCLWHELVEKSQWTVEQLWEAISFGPSKLLGLAPETLSTESYRWLCFDPQGKWEQTSDRQSHWGEPYSSNQPFKGKQITGKIIDCGLIEFDSGSQSY
ncbi:dihydroorotase [Prochlorococcus marinus]|uniref:dihydroorotase n=1 Tax=Prochlorococcus marinus TaxID=1219 RepID=UPI0022B31623|nr:dihydroorotase [Prochlorococcus marinus]